MTESAYLVKLPAKLGLLAFTIFYCWAILKNGWKRKAVIFTIIYLLFILVPIVKASVTYVPDTDDKSDIGKLNTLGYVEWVNSEHDINKVSVTTYDPSLASDGLNLYTTRKPGYALLADMKGDILHQWNLDPDNEYTGVWQYAELLENGELLAQCDENVLVKVGWQSNRIWGKKMRAHHGHYTDQNQDIYALNRKDSVTLWRGVPVPLVEDYITVFSSDGNIKRNIMLLDVAKKHMTFKGVMRIYRYILNPDKIKTFLNFKLKRRSILEFDLAFDVSHANSIFVIERDIEGLCTKGDILISMRELNLAAIFDPEKEEFVWEWGPGNIIAQHHATMLENNNILLFDNGYGRGYSRVIEIEPITKEIKWEYKGSPLEDFYSPRRGSCQRLANGNTLITESDRGNVFEVTKEGKIVWRFFVPEIDKESNKRRVIYRLLRITNPQEYPVLKDF
jgi:hypothetical protein